MLWLENIGRLLIAFLIQILLVSNLYFLGIVSPFIYIVFLLALPASLNRLWLLLIGFATGALMDVFGNSPGVHAAACTMICFVRPYLISRMVQEDDRLTGTIDSRSLGWEVYIKYVCMLVLFHHAMVFMLEAFSFHHFWLTLLQIVLSSALTIVLVLAWELLRSTR